MQFVDKNTAKQTHFTLNCRGTLIDLSSPKIMGIVNITPDSFYSNSRVKSETDALSQVEKMLADGATLIDIGGMSSRPGAEIISSKEEVSRILSIIKLIKKEFPNALLSIDTIHAETAEQAIAAGADCINDISAGVFDKKMLKVVGHHKVPFFAMHMKGTPQTMKSLTNYENLMLEMMDYFIERTIACKQAGIIDIIIDPGFGFAKTIDQNFEILSRLQEFSMLDYPILVGVSRKSMIWKTLELDAKNALNGTTALHMIALENGANILRVHDVKEANECIKLHEKIKH